MAASTTAGEALQTKARSVGWGSGSGFLPSHRCSHAKGHQKDREPWPPLYLTLLGTKGPCAHTRQTQAQRGGAGAIGPLHRQGPRQRHFPHGLESAAGELCSHKLTAAEDTQDTLGRNSFSSPGEGGVEGKGLQDSRMPWVPSGDAGRSGKGTDLGLSLRGPFNLFQQPPVRNPGCSAPRAPSHLDPAVCLQAVGLCQLQASRAAIQGVLEAASIGDSCGGTEASHGGPGELGWAHPVSKCWAGAAGSLA